MTGELFLTTTTLLLRSLRDEGDGPAWSEFVNRYRPVLVRYFQALGWSATDSEDIAQMTLVEFCAAYRSGQYERHRGRLSSWLMGIARHQAGTFARRRPPGNRADGSPPADLEDESGLTRVWNAQHDRVVCERAYELLRSSTRLDERTVRVFDLVVVHDVPPERAAAECAMTVDQVYVARSRAAARLRELVEEVRRSYEEEA